ncbi:MAG TPA: hypothetical protein VMQ17_02355 [Candidatus Sulfotelmatobacter sp.]|nr:hypothetical protein [Candidatus Sulfotelmatobacter sp.]
MPRMIDQIRASKLPSNMMQFAARGALQVPPAENIEILVHLALHNKVFADLARMTLAGWDEKASRAAAADPQTPPEVLDYFIAPDNLRPALLPALLENPSVPEGKMAKLAVSATRETIEVMLQSARVRSLAGVLEVLKTNPYLRKEEVAEIGRLTAASEPADQPLTPIEIGETVQPEPSAAAAGDATVHTPEPEEVETGATTTEHEDPDEEVKAYLKDHAHEIDAEGSTPFQAIGGIVELLGSDYFPVTQASGPAAPEAPSPGSAPAAEGAAKAKAAPVGPRKPAPGQPPKRENTLQKISHLDVKGRIQLALKGNKEERSLLIRDGTKVVALAVLEAPKLSDGEVEKFASQKNVLEAVLRQIPLKRRFMKNYIVVRNLVANPRTPLDLGLGLMKNLLVQDLKNISANKEVSETIRKLALKMYKQKLEAANKK